MTSETISYTLPNGLKVIFESAPSAPVVSLNIGVKIGSVWETDAEAGLSHVLEHMVFKGTTSFGPGDISKRVEACGGDLNAYTSHDETVYYINLASLHLEEGLTMLKEMAFDALIDPVELDREKEVVLEEIRRGKDNPHNVLDEELFALSFQKHPYGRPVIGSEATVRSFDRKTVFGFYRRWYAPNNMVLAICGDLDPEKTRAIVLKLFGEVKELPIKKPEPVPEPSQAASRSERKAAPFEGTYLALGFPIPEFTHDDIPALDLLASLLGGAPSSRLEQIVKEKKGLVTVIHAQSYTPVYPGLFQIEAVVRRDSSADIVPAIWEEIDFSSNRLFPEEAIERVKMGIKSRIYYDKETCEGTARKWMIYEMTAGDYRYEEKYLKAIDAVTAKQVRETAKKYLRRESASMVALIPKDKPVKLAPLSRSPARGDGKRFQTLSSHKEITCYRLANGLRVILRPNRRLPLLTLRLAGLGGQRLEKKQNCGISHLMADLMEKGTETKDVVKIATLVEEMAGGIDVSTGRNSWNVALTAVSQKTPLALDLFSDLILHPAFREEELKKERKNTLETIKNQEDSPAYLAFQKFQSLLFPHHPTGLPMVGTRQTITALKKEEIVRHYRKHLDPRSMVVTAVGDFETDIFLEMIDSSLGSFKGTALSTLRLKTDPPPRSIRRADIIKDKQQAHIVLGFMGTTLTSPDRYALDVLNHLLSGMGGRLFLELRDKEALAYSISSSTVEGIERGYISVYMGSEPGKLDRGISGILRELRRVQEDPITSAEIDQAKNYVIGGYRMDLQKNSAIASILSMNELYEYPLGEIDDFPTKIEAVTKEEVAAVAKKYFLLDSYTLAVVRP